MLAVTTRNRLKSARFLPAMLLARRQVDAQLRRTPGLVRWADAIGGTTAFYTLTVWANKHVMFNFMSSDAHRAMLWQFTQWTDEFWSMRWQPTADEVGDWDGKQLAVQTVSRAEPRTPLSDIAMPPRTGGPIDASTCPVTAYFGRVAARCLPSLRARLQAASDYVLIRWAVAYLSRNQYLLVSLWREASAPGLAELAGTGARWAMRWQPGDYEIGHWDGLRLRHISREAPKTNAMTR